MASTLRSSSGKRARNETSIAHTFKSSTKRSGSTKPDTLKSSSPFHSILKTSLTKPRDSSISNLPQIPKYSNSSSTATKTPISKPRESLGLPKTPKYSNVHTPKSSTTAKPLIAESSKSKLGTDNHVSPSFKCDICVDRKPFRKWFPISGCFHSYCSDCICKYVTLKIHSNITPIPCPSSGCKSILDHKHCRSILPRKVFDKWGDALCEATISPSRKFYCPFKDCSALLVKGSDYKSIVESECPICHRLFCAQCKVPWHSGIKCDKFQYQRGKKDDILFQKLAKKKKWTRCAKCKFYVEKTEGCLSMKCRCGYTFCYNCGSGRIENHYCYNCKH